MASFQQLKLVNEIELNRLIEKQIREYDPALKVLASLRREMDTIMDRKDLLPEEKLALYKTSQQRFANIKPLVGAQVLSYDASKQPRVVQENLPVPDMEIPAPAPAASNEVPSTEGDLFSQQLTDSQPDQESSSKSSTTVNDGTLGRLYVSNIDSKHLSKVNELSKLFAQSPSIISADSVSGEVILNGDKIRNSSYADLIRSLYHQSARHNLTGQNQFINALKQLFKKNPSYNPENLIYKKEYLSLFNPVPATSTSIEPTLFPASPSVASNAMLGIGKQTGKGIKKRIVLKAPPGKRIKILKCY